MFYLTWSELIRWETIQAAANKEELLEMITHGAEMIINSTEESVHVMYLLWRYPHLTYRHLINEDIDAIIARGEERTIELNSKYEGLNLEDLNNFKSDASVQQWEGEDFRTGVDILFHFGYSGLCHWSLSKKKTLNFNLLSLSKRERKSNYSVDNYFKDTLRAGPSKVDKAPKIPRAPKQIVMFVYYLHSSPSEVGSPFLFY